MSYAEGLGRLVKKIKVYLGGQMRDTKRLGCLSGTGIIAAIITTIVIVGYVYAKGGLLYNPGSLNAQSGEMLGGVASHAEIGGKCSACHTAPWESARMEDRCVDCHGNIAVQMQDVATMHGSMLTGQPDLRCRFCHPEHRGPDAKLTELGDRSFPHEVVGFSMNGHQFKASREAFICSDCHADDISSFDIQTCDTCHRQMDLSLMTAHALSYGSACLDCHDGVDGLVSNLNHADFTFKLSGKHDGLDCAKCHTNVRKLGDFQTALQDCQACHRKDEPHQGRYGFDCATCHNENGWKPAKFDHNLSVFKLEGKHGETACETCHQNSVFIGTPADCYSCHQDKDEHDGLYGSNCAMCHNPSDWDNAEFDHDLTKFPSMNCYSCHQQDDKHAGRYGTDCAACHNPSDWKDATFDHNLSSFPLTGRHTVLPCEKCHSTGQFDGLPAFCASCHGDPGYHAGMFGFECASCHSTENWFTRYSGPHPGIADEGGRGVNHGGASCRDCHTQTLHTATCTACHDSNNPDGDGGGGGDDD